MHACAHTHTHTVAGMQKHMCKSVKHLLGNVCFVDTAQCRFRVRRLWLCPQFVRQKVLTMSRKSIFIHSFFPCICHKLQIALWFSCCNTGHWPPFTPLSEYNLNLFVFLLICLFLLTIIVSSSSSNSISSSSSSHGNNACKDFSHWVMQKANHFQFSICLSHKHSWPECKIKREKFPTPGEGTTIAWRPAANSIWRIQSWRRLPDSDVTEDAASGWRVTALDR